MKTIILAYSGGLDTSIAIRWLARQHSARVVAVCVDVGEGKDLEAVKAKALAVGADKSYVIDAKTRFATDYVFPLLRANALYQGRYPLSSALSRPLIAEILVDIAHRERAFAVAHGCTGKGNDQVRFDVSIAALAPRLTVLAPVRERPLSRELAIDYATRHNIPVPITREHPFSIDENLWGRSVECGELEDPWTSPPPEAYSWTCSPDLAPDQPTDVVIAFDRGNPVALDGNPLDRVSLVTRLNQIAGSHSVGRIDMVEDRLVGIKSREVYEAPAATVLITAHQDLESITLPRELLQFKPMVENRLAELTYSGLWFSPLRRSLQAFVDDGQDYVTGEVRVRLHRGNCHVTGRRAPCSLYDHGLATYDQSDSFNHSHSVGFISLWGLPTRVFSASHAKEPVADRSCGQ